MKYMLQRETTARNDLRPRGSRGEPIAGGFCKSNKENGAIHRAQKVTSKVEFAKDSFGEFGDFEQIKRLETAGEIFAELEQKKPPLA